MTTLNVGIFEFANGLLTDFHTLLLTVVGVVSLLLFVKVVWAAKGALPAVLMGGVIAVGIYWVANNIEAGKEVVETEFNDRTAPAVVQPR